MYTYIGQNFIQMIKSINPMAKPASGGREVVVRCMFCGDSKNINHAHMYISVPTSENELSFYHCKKCPAHGLVDENFLQRLGCTDSNTLVEVSRHTSELLKLPKYKTLKSIDIYPLRYDYIRDDPRNEGKLRYINNRIGANFSYADLCRLKIFLNLADIVNINKLEMTRDQRIMESLDKYFIGFISYDNSYATLRNITTKELYKSINKRYINYSLVNKQDDSKDYYIIPTSIDITSPEPVKIHLAEGAFDILSIFYNLNHQNSMQNIYIACGGKSYTQALEFILTEIGLINYEIHYYPDTDVTNYEFNKTLSSINLLPADIYIHHNVAPNEKDFGVPADRIKDSVQLVSRKEGF